MRDSFTPYLLWVLLPVTLAGAMGHYLTARESQALGRESSVRLGRTGAALLAGEMGIQTRALARDASLLTDPDPGSPLIRAALSGDTVVALGTSGGQITLSLALAEESGDSLRVRGASSPFPAEAMDLFSARTGRGAALYLRGRKARGAPADFGAASLPGRENPASGPGASLPPGSVLLPLAAPGALTSPAQLLVAPLSPPSRGFPLWQSGATLLLALTLGGVARVLLSRGRKGPGRRTTLLSLTGLPLLLLWLLLVQMNRVLEAEAQELLRGDIVRVLALLKDGGSFLAPGELPETSGFHFLRKRSGEVVATTRPPGPTLTALLRLPLPPPAFPILGKVEAGNAAVVYGIFREGPGRGILLAAPDPAGKVNGFRLLLAGLGGVASILVLVFLLGSRPGPGVEPAP